MFLLTWRRVKQSAESALWQSSQTLDFLNEINSFVIIGTWFSWASVLTVKLQGHLIPCLTTFHYLTKLGHGIKHHKPESYILLNRSPHNDRLCSCYQKLSFLDCLSSNLLMSCPDQLLKQKRSIKIKIFLNRNHKVCGVVWDHCHELVWTATLPAVELLAWACVGQGMSGQGMQLKTNSSQGYLSTWDACEESMDRGSPAHVVSRICNCMIQHQTALVLESSEFKSKFSWFLSYVLMCT